MQVPDFYDRKLSEMALVFSNPISFQFERETFLFVNSVNIIKEVRAAIEAWDKWDFVTFGYKIGQAFSQVHQGVNYQLCVGCDNTHGAEVLAHVKGLWYSLGHGMGFPEAVEMDCLNF